MARTPRAGARDALLQAASGEFARRGLERARVEDIARHAGISKGAFYLHFATKEDALRELASRFLGALHDHALRRDELEARAGRAARGRATLSHRIEAECAIEVDLLEVLWRNRQLLAAVEGASGEPHRGLAGDLRRELRALASRRVQGGGWAGARVRADVPADLVADLVAGAYQDLARRMADMREKPDLAACARALLHILYEGILERPAAAARRRSRPRSSPPTRTPLTGRSRSRSSR